MPHHGPSGRIVVDVDPEMKRRLYASLALSGSTLKDWFSEVASAYCANGASPGRAIIETASPGSPSNGKPHSGASLPPPAIANMLAKKYKVISMFSGCGGMDLGFTGGFKFLGKKYDALPYDVVWANDFSRAACTTYSGYFGRDIHVGDVWEKLDSMPTGVDLLIGGFPCQDISVNGKRLGVAGKRSGLYKAMVEAIRRTKPRVFVAENVKGLLMKYNHDSLKRVLEDFGNLGYSVSYRLYKTANYGVPQARERVFIVGTSREARQFFHPEPERDSSSWITAEQALADLERRPQDPAFNHIWSAAKVSPEQGNRRLSPHRPAHTIRAECHGNIQFHYRLPRRISMREAARIQSFPDNFVFQAGLREIERQVGNAVPPVMAWHIARSVLNCLS